ncbi:hypothetical protein FJ423_04720 [Mesorhizobium sp. B2-8-9]|nr:hypothetical protein FJ423_04720 [Mesorhizobium sp. B2-8-9]
MAWYLNSYHCYRCDQYWVEQWSCGCDSECPYCEARNVTALDSHDLSVLVVEEDHRFVVLASPPTAEHRPDYKPVGAFDTPTVAEAFADEVRLRNSA